MNNLERMAAEAENRWAKRNAPPEGPDGITRILAVSLDGRQPAKIYAIYDGRRLVIAKAVLLQGPFEKWAPGLEAEVETKAAGGYIVVVEDRSGYVSDEAPAVDLEAVDVAENRVLAYVALDRYFALDRMGLLDFSDETKRLRFTESKVEPQQDEKGRTKYNVDWQQFTAGSRAVLLAVLAAMHEPISERFIHEAHGEVLGRKKAPDHPALRVAEALFPDWEKWVMPWREPY